MKSKLYPFLFYPVYKNYIWGGNKIYSFFKRTPDTTPCAESWEISARLEGMSIVRNGNLAGESLKKIWDKFGNEIAGDKNSIKGQFPLIVKILDAKENLSLQVHPSRDDVISDAKAKTEMWYVLNAGENSFVYAGFKKETSKKEILSRIEDGTLMKIIRKIKVSTGDVIFIPGGRIHCVGAGCLLLEIQQNSNTTYRVFDWNRTNQEGKSRPLHINEALKCINLKDTLSPLHTPVKIAGSNQKSVKLLLECDFFRVEEIEIAKEILLTGNNSFEIIFVNKGDIIVKSETNIGTEVPVVFGSTCLIPASIQPCCILPLFSHTKASIIRILPCATIFGPTPA